MKQEVRGRSNKKKEKNKIGCSVIEMMKMSGIRFSLHVADFH